MGFGEMGFGKTGFGETGGHPYLQSAHADPKPSCD